VKRTLVIALLIIAALGLVVWRLAAVRQRTNASTRPTVEAKPVRVAVVERGDIEQSLEITGTLEAERRADVASKLTGKVDRVFAVEGRSVAAGQVLAVLDQKDYRAQVAQAEAGVRAASANVGVSRARLAALRAGSRPQELRQAEQSVRQAKASLDNATLNYNRMRDLAAEGALAQQQMDAAQLQLDLARAQYETALQHLDLVKEGARKEDVVAAEEQVRQAEAAEAQARAALQMAKLNLEYTVVRSPISGVVAKRYVEPGEAISMSNPAVAAVVDNSRVYVRGDVSEASIREVRPGQPAMVTVDAYPGRKFTGQVVEVLPSADVKSRMFSVKIRIPNPYGELKEGMFARARIAVERRAGVLLIPRRAVLSRGKDQIAFVVSGDQVEERKLALGLSEGDSVEVRGGMGLSEQVVVEGQSDLHDGDRVAHAEQEAR